MGKQFKSVSVPKLHVVFIIIHEMHSAIYTVLFILITKITIIYIHYYHSVDVLIVYVICGPFFY